MQKTVNKIEFSYPEAKSGITGMTIPENLSEAEKQVFIKDLKNLVKFKTISAGFTQKIIESIE